MKNPISIYQYNSKTDDRNKSKCFLILCGTLIYSNHRHVSFDVAGNKFDFIFRGVVL